MIVDNVLAIRRGLTKDQDKETKDEGEVNGESKMETASA